MRCRASSLDPCKWVYERDVVPDWDKRKQCSISGCCGKGKYVIRHRLQIKRVVLCSKCADELPIELRPRRET